MRIYTLNHLITLPEEPDAIGLRLTERSIYGSSRVGTENPNVIIARSDESLVHEFDYVQTIGDKRYELSNHLGNVLEVVTDRKLAVETALESGIVDYYVADVVSQSDYYPFGMLLPNRNEGSDEYRYSFQGQEKDDEIKGENNSVNYSFRMHGPRIGRFFTVDPLTSKYPHYTPYSFSGNKVIAFMELEGLEEIIYTKKAEWIGDEIEIRMENSEHLSCIIESISNPMLFAEAKIYVTNSYSNFRGENGYTTYQALDIINYVDQFEEVNADKLDGTTLAGQDFYRSTEFKKYLACKNVTDALGQEFVDQIKQDAENNCGVDVILVNIDVAFSEQAECNDVLISTFHEFEAHVADHLGVTTNDLTSNLTGGASDHAVYFAFYENRDYYESIGFTEEKLLQGYSPPHELTAEGSPACETVTEVNTSGQ